MDKKELLTEAQKRHNMNAAAIVEYIETFSDPFSFVETNKFLTYSDSSDEMTDAVITGYATIEGRPVAVAVQNSAVRQGCFSKATIHKMIAITEYAVKREIPLIFGLDSFGTNHKGGCCDPGGVVRSYFDYNVCKKHCACDSCHKGRRFRAFRFDSFIGACSSCIGKKRNQL